MIEMGKKERDQGQRGERWLVQKLIEHGYERATRTDQSRGGAAPDVEGTPFRIESKYGKKHFYEKALHKAEEDAIEADDHRPVIVVHRKQYQDGIVTMKFNTFLWILENFMSPSQVDEYLERGVDAWDEEES